MSYWQPYLIAGVVGLLVGIEREKANPSQKVLGLRTFFLISILGAVAKALHNPWLAALVAAFTLGLILISYFNQTKTNAPGIDRGLTTEFAAALVFCLGYAAKDLPALTALLGPLVAVILFSKKRLHRFSKNLKASELEAALLLFLVAMVVINLFPDVAIDPWGVFNPKKFGYLVLLLAALEFSSYIMAKIIGEKTGTLLIGFLGGFVSSTAVLLSSARQAKKSPQNWRTPLCSTLAATLSSYVELALILGFISKDLFVKFLPCLGAGLLFGTITLVTISRMEKGSRSELNLKSPLDWFGILRLSLLLAAILASVSFTKNWLGERATLLVSMLTGLFELHGVSLANATLFIQGQLSQQSATFNILLAIVSSLFAKVVIGWGVGRGRFAYTLTAILLSLMSIFLVVGQLTLA